MKKLKETLTKIVLLPIKYPKLYQKCPLKAQNSILLHGPPGCGKTLLAEALINEEGLNSICVRGPELLSKYIGASEAAVRDLFRRAHLARPCVVFFDEFESLVAKRGADSTGVTDRVVNQFLTILDGVERMSHDVYIIAATSRPDMIDPAMLRPGRLDQHLYCPVPDEEERLDILRVLSKDMHFEDGVVLADWARHLGGFTGADIQAFLFSAQLNALHDIIGLSQGGRSPPRDNLAPDFQIVIAQKHVMLAHESMAAGVRANSANLAARYPAKIGALAKQRVAMRATLA